MGWRAASANKRSGKCCLDPARGPPMRRDEARGEYADKEAVVRLARRQERILGIWLDRHRDQSA